jgi:hypothetical protein
MGLLKKAATFSVIQVQGNIPDLNTLKSSIEGSTTPNIEGSTAPECFSFCKINDVFDKEVIQGDQTIAFGLRHDKKVVSKSLFKKKYSEGLKKLKVEAKQAKRKVEKDEKVILKDNILANLYAGAKPLEKLIEILWDTETKTIYVGTANKALIDAFVSQCTKLFPEMELIRWQPLSPETQNSDVKGSKDNFQNAFFTWVYYETKINKDKFWIPLNITFVNDSAQVSIKGDTDISLESYLSIYHGRLVDSLDIGYSDDDQQYEMTLTRGTWAFKKFLTKPEIVHENLDSAAFERSKLFKEVTDKFTKLVKEFEEIRNNDDKNRKFWKSLSDMASQKIKESLGESL